MIVQDDPWNAFNDTFYNSFVHAPLDKTISNEETCLQYF